MSENTLSNLFSEAPASWNTRYSTPDGFVCQLTLRGETGKDLLDKANAAIQWLIEHGYTPGDKPHYPSKPKQSYSKPAADNFNIDKASSSADPATICPIHHVEMKRWEKDDRVWFSHKTEEGWCTGKAR